jgi:hypothetical protein
MPSAFRNVARDPDKFEAHASIVSGSHIAQHSRDEGVLESRGCSAAMSFYANVLQMQIVSEDALKGVDESPAAVRRAIERRRNDPGLFVDGFTCVRAKETK